MAMQQNKELIPQHEYNDSFSESYKKGDYQFDQLWQPSPTKQEMVWLVPSSLTYRYGKRIMDIVLAIPTLIILAPLILLVSILIKIDSPGPVLFKQVRVGKWGQPFTCVKFRSMYVDAEDRKDDLVSANEADGPVFKMKNDPRVTPVGRVIRKLSIDEIPQLINVIKGEMSLVGPRPPLPSEMIKYEYHQLRRLDVTPGITGLQQVSGRSDLSFEEWIALDIEYVERRSLWFDFVILLRTIPAVISTKGAY